MNSVFACASGAISSTTSISGSSSEGFSFAMAKSKPIEANKDVINTVLSHKLVLIPIIKRFKSMMKKTAPKNPHPEFASSKAGMSDAKPITKRKSNAKNSSINAIPESLKIVKVKPRNTINKKMSMRKKLIFASPMI